MTRFRNGLGPYVLGTAAPWTEPATADGASRNGTPLLLLFRSP